MNDSKQYQIDGSKLTLSVKKAPLLVRLVMFLFSILSFLFPLLGMICGLAMGTGMHIGYLIMLFIFGLVGFYVLRISLWNTYGKETVIFKEKIIEYYADYGWFKDGRKQMEINQPVEFGIRQIGYEEDNKGGLIIGLEEPNITCVTKMSKTELEELIDELKTLTDSFGASPA